MQKTVAIIVSIITALFALGGREIYKSDISNRLIIQGMGIDVENDGTYTVTIQAINTTTQSSSANENSGATVKIYKVNDKTIYSAMKSVIEYEGKVPLYSQNQIIVISRAIAEKGLDEIINFFIRDADIGPNVYIAMAENRAEDILSEKTEGEIIPKNVDDAIDAADYEPEIFKLQLYELVNRYKDYKACFAMPVLTKVEEVKDQKGVQVKETALFCNGKYLTTISRQETVLLNCLLDRVYNGDFSFEDENRITLNIVNLKATKKVNIKNNKLVFNIKIKVDADVAEIDKGVSSSSDKTNIDELSAKGEKYLKEQLTAFLEKLYWEEKCDVLGLSRLILRSEPSFYREQKENLDNVLRDSQYNIEVDITLRRMGHEFLQLS